MALNYAQKCGVLVVAAAGNGGTLASSTITRHPGVIPVIAYDRNGRPMPDSNLGRAIGARGVGAIGDNVTSLAVGGALESASGAPFVSGTLALLHSLFEWATAEDLRIAMTVTARRQRSLVPPLLNAARAYETLQARRRN
jgi:subtilisin family serine protease